MPPLGPFVGLRLRLINTLNQGLQNGYKLTLVSAPAFILLIDSLVKACIAALPTGK